MSGLYWKLRTIDRQQRSSLVKVALMANWIDTGTAARLLHVSERTVRNHCRCGWLVAKPRGGRGWLVQLGADGLPVQMDPATGQRF
jgi:hypothetical protein